MTKNYREHYATWMADAVKHITEEAVKCGLINFEVNVRPMETQQLLIVSLYVTNYEAKEVQEVNYSFFMYALDGKFIDNVFKKASYHLVNAMIQQLQGDHNGLAN